MALIRSRVPRLMVTIAAAPVAALIMFGPFVFTPPARAEGPRMLVEVPVAGHAQLLRLSQAGFDVAGIDRKTGTAGVVVDGAALDRLTALGFTYTLKDVSHPLRGPGEALADYTDPEELSAFMDQMAAAYPNLVEKVVLKDALFEGQKLLAVKITADVTGDHDRPVFLLDAQHHAREVMTAEIAKDAIQVLASGYGTDPRITHWLDNLEVWVVASVNPDGAMYVFTQDNMWRKNRDPVCSVDINRNYDFNWAACNGSDDLCSSDIYRGPSPASEPETQGMSALADEIRPEFSLSYHSYGEYILFPYGCYNPSDMAVYDDLGNTLNSILEDDTGATGRYKTGPGWSTIYPTDGSSDDALYGRYGAFAFVIEVNCCSFQPDYAQWRDITVERQRAAWEFFLDKTLTYPAIQGRVTDAATGAPLKATVVLQEVALGHGEAPRQASARGRYAWPLQGGRTYHATFSMPGYLEQTHEVAVGTGPATLDVQLVSNAQAAIPRDPLPADKALNQDRQVVLSWTCNEATSYEVYFGTTTAPPLVATVSQPSYAPPALDIGKTYTWQVVALSPLGRTSGPSWSFSTRPYGITGAKKAGNPFRILVNGQGFKAGVALTADGVPVPATVIKNPTRLVAKGTGLKSLVPKGRTVQLVVRDGNGGASEPFAFRW